MLLPCEGVVSRRLVGGGGRAVESLFIEPDLIENIYEPFSRTIELKDFDTPFALKMLRAARNVVRGAAGFIRLLRRVRKERFDIVFCNGTSANFVGDAIAAVTGVPVIWHVLYPSVSPIVRPLHRRLAAGKNVRSIICVSRVSSPRPVRG